MTNKKDLYVYDPKTAAKPISISVKSGYIFIDDKNDDDIAVIPCDKWSEFKDIVDDLISKTNFKE